MRQTRKEISSSVVKGLRSNMIILIVFGAIVINTVVYESKVVADKKIIMQDRTKNILQILEDENKKLQQQLKSTPTPTLTSRGETSVDDEINGACQKYGVPVKLVKAVIQQESGGNQKCISRAGAIGIMQLMPDTAKSLGVNPNIRQQNIEGGVKHLSYLLKSYDGNVELALAAYNAGSNAVSKYKGIPPYGETTAYVRNIMSTYRKLAGG